MGTPQEDARAMSWNYKPISFLEECVVLSVNTRQPALQTFLQVLQQDQNVCMTIMTGDSALLYALIANNVVMQPVRCGEGNGGYVRTADNTNHRYWISFNDCMGVFTL